MFTNTYYALKGSFKVLQAAIAEKTERMHEIERKMDSMENKCKPDAQPPLCCEKCPACAECDCWADLFDERAAMILKSGALMQKMREERKKSISPVDSQKQK